MNRLFTEGLHIKSKTGITIDIPICSKVTIIMGDSATGKTKMINQLSELLKTNEITECNIPKENIRVIKDKDTFDWLKLNIDIENQIIFIDKFDLLDLAEAVNFIERSRNYFVICAHRRIPQCGWERESFLEMYHDGTKYKLVPFNYNTIK